MTATLTGTRPLLKTTAKHDGRLQAPWVVIATALAASSVAIYSTVFPTEESRQALSVAVASNPALSIIFGPAFDLTTADGFAAWRGLALGGFLAALGAIFAVVRATRGQEDSGQAELLASGVLGRSSRLFTGVAMAAIGSLVLGLVAGGATALFGGAFESSMLLGATFTATGWMFAGVAAVAAQIAADARTASSISVATLGTLFILRGFLYSVEAPSWTSWINPLSWMTETKPASGSIWWPLLLAVALTLVLLAAAFKLEASRDFGQGKIKPAPGPARGTVLTTLGLARRLNRGTFIAWAIAFVVLGMVFGFLTTSLPDLLSSNSAVAQVVAAGAATPADIARAFLVTILSMVGIIASIFGVQVMTRVRSEEMEDRLEPIMATATARQRYFGSNVLVALVGPSVFVLIAGAVIAALGAGADLGFTFADGFVQAIAVIPGVWTVVAFSALIIGARPKVAVAAWAGVLASFVLTLLGPTFGLDDWVLGISPFWHVPHTGSSDPDYSGLFWISLFTLGFLLVGFAGFRRRDLAR
jgi:ABC-2 type transport system permease protein